MRALELITDCATGQLSHTKLWTNIAYFAATIAFIRYAVFSDSPFDMWLWLTFLGIVGGHNVASKALSIRKTNENK